MAFFSKTNVMIKKLALVLAENANILAKILKNS
jgi:hypothetical protein